MGCICSKPSTREDYIETQRAKGSNKSSRLFVTPSKREEVVLEAETGGGNDGTARLISKSQENVTSTPLSSDEGEKIEVADLQSKKATHQRRATVGFGPEGADPSLGIFNVPKAVKGEQVAAGWPSWLTAVAGEAVKGWVPRRAESFEKLDKIGQGTYSNVYKARDLETGKIVALKKVRFVNMDPESVRFMAREICILRRLDHPNILKLEGLVTSRMSCSLYLVFEYMEHDLAGLASLPGVKFTEAQVKCYMQQLFRGLEHCHGRGVLHRDIKGSNLLVNNDGILKIGDFGLATFFRPDQKQPLTSRVVTLWYRPPELLLGATEYGVAVDLWSTGCILAELLAGKPIMPGRTEVEQLHKIFKLCGSPSEDYWKTSKLPHATIFKPQHPYKRCVAETFKDFPSSALALMDVLLAIEPGARGTATSALKSEFFTSRPLACDPSSLPKYPPSKEFDAKLRDEEARRRRAAASKGNGSESEMSKQKDSKSIPAPDANAELQASMRKRQGQSTPKSTSEKYNLQDESGSGFPLDPLKGETTRNGFSHSGPLMHPSAFGNSWNNKAKENELQMDGQAFGSSNGSNGSVLRTQRSYMPQGTTNLASMSGLVAARSSGRSGSQRDNSVHDHWPQQRPSTKYNIDVAEPSEKIEWTHHLLDRPTSSYKKDHKGYGAKKNRIHYSGPLMPPGGNLDEMLKEHEKQIQQAVRRARLDKARTKKNYDEKTQFEALLYPGRNGCSDV